MGKKLFCFFQTAETENRTPNSGVKSSGANHYPSAPALLKYKTLQCKLYVVILSQQYNNDAETRRWPGAGLMSDHRVRRQLNINPT